MVSIPTARKLALAFEAVEEKPHFEKTSFRVKNKIFATLDKKKQQLTLRLSEVDQSVFSDYNRAVVYPVQGGWGKQGWTIIELKKVPRGLFTDALTTAYCTVAPKNLARLYLPK